VAQQRSRTGDAPHTHVSVMTVIPAVLLSLSLVPGLESHEGFPRALVASLALLIARGLYLLFRHAP
jgi:hypothetical protein